VPASGQTTRAAFTALSSRRIWSLAEKRATLAEMAVPGAVVMEVARRHGIAQSLLYRWRTDAAKAAAAAKAAPAFLPVTIEAPPAATARKTATKPRACPSPLASIIEVDLSNGRTVRATTDIEASALVRIVAALESKA
jgi:transposase